ncbi:MAG TPA: hypothetical protein VF134_04060 [Candidatus Dormibacteraeota bacterium]
MKWLAAALGVLLGSLGCGTAGGPPTARADPVPAAIAADDALRAAFSSASPQFLEGHFIDRALTVLRLQVAQLAVRGIRREEVLDSRRVVHVGGSAERPQVVLRISARQRWLASGAPPPPAATLRQWSAVLRWTGDRWLVCEAGDLPPPQWWAA